MCVWYLSTKQNITTTTALEKTAAEEIHFTNVIFTQVNKSKIIAFNYASSNLI